MQAFLSDYMQSDRQYRAGAIYQAFLEEHDSEISRKDFEMFLRYQVMKDDGLLKRVSHGIYEIRTDPDDRGVLFTRGSPREIFDAADAAMLAPYRTDAVSLDEILDDSLALTAKLQATLNQLYQQVDSSPAAQYELRNLKTNLLKTLDQTITGVTALMAWCDDNMDEGIQTDEDLDTGMSMLM